MRGLADHIAVVTGSSRGIGRAIAARLIAEGAAVVVNAATPGRAEAAAADLGASGGRAIGVAADVSLPEDVDRVFARCREAFGACTLLVNNAGFETRMPFEEMDLAEWDRMMAVKLRGAFLCCRAAIGRMLAAGDGSIINIASRLGQVGAARACHYSAANAGLIGLTKALAREVSARGVRVNAVAPGPINTDIAAADTSDWQAERLAQLPLGIFGEPEDVADTVAFLASPQARLYVGQTLGPNSGGVML